MKKHRINIFLGFYFLILVGLTFWVYNLDIRGYTKMVSGTVVAATRIDEYLTFTLVSGSDISFGELFPGNPVSAPNPGLITQISSNTPTGYAIAMSDSKVSSQSALKHSDGSTNISDYFGTVGSPSFWSGTGLGMTLFAADTSKEAKWGTGSSYNDSNNRYAGIPQNSTIVHTVNKPFNIPNLSSFAFKLDVLPSQKPGYYSGKATLTVTTLLS